MIIEISAIVVALVTITTGLTKLWPYIMSGYEWFSHKELYEKLSEIFSIVEALKEELRQKGIIQ